MLRELVDVDWSDATEVVPAVLTALGMPFTYSVANGVAFGFIAYAGLKLLTGRARGAGDGVGHRCRLPVQVLLPARALSTAARAYAVKNRAAFGRPFLSGRCYAIVKMKTMTFGGWKCCSAYLFLRMKRGIGTPTVPVSAGM
jgi:hypothetical protein